MIYYIIIAWIIGIVTGVVIVKMGVKNAKCVGNMVVNKYEEGILYSLEIDGNPEKIQYEKEILFKVVVPDVESVRE